MRCEIELEFGDGTYLFRLPLKQIAELQDKCNAGIQEIFGRIIQGKARIEDLTETLRLGLIGGGMEPVQARRLIERYAFPPKFSEGEKPVEYLWTNALSVLSACLQGYDDKKKETAETKGTGDSTSPPPMETVPS
jgi:hypothetical protein